ncbi:MAG: GGDEF domain-containing protein [Candidatus Thiodiazotropha taylori]|uniref:Diguanylate cyclase DosC n=1 Tax=Candidatus Thiodiazotropha taylori TaxID=2792791 RepID=A0A9E4T9D7_9GAMM|nr:GGDEF domain-containing protein [Candidatus Thiodiazotropha taylori]MCG8081491.1 GGDEF domain-containing protein [Candidatus Thiodiazotropha taylori]MCW4259525.1 GGDEF domain-containing protein [Candidatus Thiodiazotropha taylori]
MFSEQDVPYIYFSESTRSEVQAIIDGHSEVIVNRFYQDLTANPTTAQFLTHEEIESRLKRSMVEWLKLTFDHQKILDDRAAFESYQTNIGRVHSRASINLQLVNYARMMLKRSVVEVIRSNHADSIDLLCYATEMIDYAIDLFNDSYLHEVIETTRHQQALKIITSGHQLALDLERGKNELTVWMKDAIWNITHDSKSSLTAVADLNIYHWLKHKGSFTFADQDLSALLLSHCESLLSTETSIIDEIEKEESAGRSAALNGLMESAMSKVDELCVGLAKAIDLILAAEERKDALTKTLSRRYLPAIAQREVLYARTKGAPFSVMMIDIDDFKLVNDQYGHRVGDQVLEMVAESLLERVRPGDYVFRYGGEEFLIIVSETDKEVCQVLAEEMKSIISSMEMSVSDNASVSVTVSIGIAEYDFHPDFLRTLSKADRRVYLAKDRGKNRVIAEDGAGVVS